MPINLLIGSRRTSRYVLGERVETRSADMFISIKRFLEQRSGAGEAAQDVGEALRQLAHLLLDGMATHVVPGRPADANALRRSLRRLTAQTDEPQSAMDLLGIGSDAVEALENYCQQTTTYLNDGNEQMQSMVAMLTQTVADLSGQTDASVARLQAIEKQVELASGLEDRRALRASLENCLIALREAAAHQRSNSANTVEKLQHQIGKAQQRTANDAKQAGLSDIDIDLRPEPSGDSVESVSTSYVAAFKLQRAEHIEGRFGENAKHQMLALIGKQLKTALGPSDRLLRWKGTSFVMFLNTTETAVQIRGRLGGTVAAIGRQYIEVGRNSAMLSVGIDWIMFPQSQYPSMEAVFTEVDAFLSDPRARNALTTGAEG
jgi:GGDEF domain-containing protein